MEIKIWNNAFNKFALTRYSIYYERYADNAINIDNMRHQKKHLSSDKRKT